MKIKYISHSGFIIENSTFALMIDCCGLTAKSPEVTVLANKNLYILASHFHGDHFDPAIMSFDNGHCKWILSKEIRRKISVNANVHFLAKGDIFQDENVKIKAYGSTDVGISFFIEACGRKIFHAGDLNNWHWIDEETPTDAAKNEKFFLDELAEISAQIDMLDIAMFPVDPRLGKEYKRGAEQFLDSIKTGLFVPMHFWDDYGAANAFKPYAEKKGCRFAEIKTKGDEFKL